MNLYEALGVAKTATSDAIKAAYRKKAKKAHPDHGGKREDFERLCKARSILLHPDKRARFALAMDILILKARAAALAPQGKVAAPPDAGKP